jgi:hypothetical protein
MEERTQTLYFRRELRVRHRFACEFRAINDSNNSNSPREIGNTLYIDERLVSTEAAFHCFRQKESPGQTKRSDSGLDGWSKTHAVRFVSEEKFVLAEHGSNRLPPNNAGAALSQNLSVRTGYCRQIT